MLELANVTSYYGNTPILQNLSLAIPAGSMTCVLGRNGVGKTTLAKTILGLTTRAEGTLRIRGQDALRMPTHRRAQAGIGYIPQGRGILPRFSVRENIQLGTFARDDGKREIPPRVLEIFPYLAENLDKRAGTLSGGQAQQLAVARALASDPSLLILDEPTEGIQPNIVVQIQDLIRSLNREFGLTVLLIEQNIQFARTAADRFVIMDKGTAVAQGAIADLGDGLIQKHLTI